MYSTLQHNTIQYNTIQVTYKLLMFRKQITYGTVNTGTNTSNLKQNTRSPSKTKIHQDREGTLTTSGHVSRLRLRSDTADCAALTCLTHLIPLENQL